MEFGVGVGEWSQESVRRGQSWSSELELESGIRGQESHILA